MKQFFRYMFASTLGTVLGFILIFILGTIATTGIIAVISMASKSKEIKVKDNSLLVVDISQRLVEREKPNPFEGIEIEGFDDDGAISLHDFLKAIEVAKTDDNIKGIYLKGTQFAGSLTSMDAVREALIDFQDSGKFVVSYNEVYTQAAYYVASAASEAYIFQEGMIELFGLRTELAFFKNTMEKLGIKATILKGPDNLYKSAIEPFSREDMSEPNKEQIKRILDVIWERMSNDIAASRDLNIDSLNAIVNDLKIRKPEDAVALNLFDGAIYYDELLANFRTKLALEEDEDIEVIEIDDYAKTIDAPADEEEDKSWELKDEIAVVYALGGINSGEGDDESIGSESLAKAIREAREDEDIKAIVMRVNSPGGSAMASEVIWREAKLAAEEKPFVVSFGNVAASGGYYISTHADRIFAGENTITGSIGVFGLIPDMREFLNEKMGITFDGVKTHDHADFGSLQRGFDEAELALLNEYITETYEEFLAKVAEGRGMTVEEVDSIARGRVWVGTDAMDIGLVDEMGNLDDAIAHAAMLAELEDYDLIELPKQKDPWEEFFSNFSENSRAQVGQWVFGEHFEWIQKVEQIEKMEGIQTRMPFEIEVH